MVIKAFENASKRTKERIKQHGPSFLLIHSGFPSCLNNVEAFLVMSKTTDWQGWLPKKEIEMKEE